MQRKYEMVYTRVGVWIPQCPPKNWETRSWSGDGRRPSGALHCNWGCLLRLTRSSLLLTRSSCARVGHSSFLKPAPAGVGSSRGVMISSVGVIPRYGLHLCPFTVNSFPS
ncbi:unnamed protein product [Microthlaspi erraticum]|uniref:Uncharacterized protein n=1 Tax=Microthlaspi erraticum TaxID=1685480 RepID=A0A6D2HQD7_9BRAS|nr:unnamed protein product [Microthlaspi erraticum]